MVPFPEKGNIPSHKTFGMHFTVYTRTLKLFILKGIHHEEIELKKKKKYKSPMHKICNHFESLEKKK